MQRSPRQVGLTAVTVLTMAMALTVVTGSTASADHLDLSNPAAIESYLVSIGVDPNEAVWQEGLKNYAGPSCPGVGWSCVPANAPIVQIAAPLGTNLFHCTGLDCVAVQVALGAGQNGAGCDRGDKHADNAVQECVIAQANTTGNNVAGINQSIEQKGTTVTARQVARIEQDNESGKNFAGFRQVVVQSSQVKSTAQSQDANQAATVDQETTTGDNTSTIAQRQNQTQRASGSSGLITQKQNTVAGSDFFCDGSASPFATPTHDQEKNQCAEVMQDSNVVPATGGSIQSRLNQAITESQTASNAGSVDQDQGTFPGGLFTPGGQGGTVVQNSSAPDDSEAIQDTNQSQTATRISGGVGLGDQFKNTGDPRCCATQTINPGSTADITQTTNQFASSGDNAVQFASLQGDCDSFGTCTVEQSATVNGETTTNDCSGTSCHIVIECFSLGEGEGTMCVASEGGVD